MDSSREQSPDTKTRRLKLYRAALNGDWAVAKGIYDIYRGEIGEPITGYGDTALHVAAAAKRIDFVKELMKMMNAKDLDKTNDVGSTAFFFAAASGMVELAKETMKGNIDIAMIPDKEGTYPIVRAASLGHKDMVNFLYKETKGSLTDEIRIELLVKLIETDLYGVALQLLEEFLQIATKRAKNEETALHVLARKNLTYSKRGIFQRCFNLGANDVENINNALKLVERLWKEFILLDDSEILDCYN